MADSKYSVYIDESGDLAIDRGTKWFVLSAVIIKKSDEELCLEKLKKLKDELKIDEIHFKEINTLDKRFYIVKELAPLPFTYTNVIVNTSKITIKGTTGEITPENLAYNYCCRYLIERVSWFLRDNNVYGDILFSSRGEKREKDLISYIRKLISQDDNQIEDRFNAIASGSAGKNDLLQLADVCASSVFHLHEPTKQGFILPCYYYALASHLYNRSDKDESIGSYGMKYMNENMIPTEEYFTRKMICR